MEAEFSQGAHQAIVVKAALLLPAGHWLKVTLLHLSPLPWICRLTGTHLFPGVPEAKEIMENI